MNPFHPKTLWRRYVRYIQHSIIPKPYSHEVKMNLVIKAGQKTGTALIPCTIYAMDHSIDLNPALIRKKDRKTVAFVPAKRGLKAIQVDDDPDFDYKIDGKKLFYNSAKYAVELTDEETEKGFSMEAVTLAEYERCPSCQQKVVLAEVNQTRYRSCPSITVMLADPAKVETVVPVQFGVNKSAITGRVSTTPWIVVAAIIGSSYIIWDRDVVLTPIITWLFSGLSVPTAVPGPGLMPVLVWVLKGALLIWLWLFAIPIVVYGNVKLAQWYASVKETMVKTKYATKKSTTHG